MSILTDISFFTVMDIVYDELSLSRMGEYQTLQLDKMMTSNYNEMTYNVNPQLLD